MSGLTSKDKNGFVSLTSQNNQTVEHIITKSYNFKKSLEKIPDVIKTYVFQVYSEVKCIFSEMQVYSTKHKKKSLGVSKE